jgi:alpha-amylase
MKKIYSIIVLVALTSVFISLKAQAPAQCTDVMLQGFYWDSWNPSATISPQGTTRWTDMYQISGDVSGVFDVVWLPPSAYSSGGTGYIPGHWCNQNGAWGTVDNLKKLINALHSNNCKVIADIVVNHRNARGVNSSWTDFFAEDFGSYGQFQLDNTHICSTDEAKTQTPAPTGAPDTGDNFDGGRDLDHTSAYVQNAVKAYLKWMKNEIGFDGWRYDMVKGFSGSYIKDYSEAADIYMAVGEYFDYNYDAVKNWVQATVNSSMAFDFPAKNAALNTGLAAGNYTNMQWLDGSTPRPAGLIHSPQSRKYAVTFVDNHDTYRDAANKYTGNIPQAYAFIMSAPGVPCVFYQHWKLHTAAINNIIKARKAVGLHSESSVEVQNTSGYYKAYSVGLYGEMLTYIGNVPASENPSGYTLACSGGTGATTYKIFTKLTSNAGQTAYQAKLDAGVNPPAATAIGAITLTAQLPTTWTSPKIWVWDLTSTSVNFTGGVWPGVALTAGDDGKYSITLNNVTAKEVGVIFNDGVSTATGLQTVDLSTTEDACWNLIEPGSGRYFNALKVSCSQGGAVNDVEAKTISVYPNPVTDFLYINTDKNIAQISVVSATGQTVIVTEKQTVVDVSNLLNGIYFLKINFNDNTNAFAKFMKK